MKILIHVSDDDHKKGVDDLLTKFKFGNMSGCHFEHGSAPNPVTENSDATFCLDVLDGEEDLKAIDLGLLLERGPCSLLFFNQEVQVDDEPKVVFATDHSDQAAANLEQFKRLKPVGFGGAMVISEDESNPSGVLNHELNQKFLARMKSAVQATQANVIIANYDFQNLSQKSSQLSNILKLVLQNRCHVLVLKT